MQMFNAVAIIKCLSVEYSVYYLIANNIINIIVWLYQNNLIQYFDDSVITELVKRDVIF